MKDKDIKKVMQFISEAGMLKNVTRSGWSVLGIKKPESVADHCFRCLIIGYVLAMLEKAHLEKVMLMTMLNDMCEARITDLHKMAQRYIKTETAEDSSYFDQISGLPESFKMSLVPLYKEYRTQKTKESIIARDADILECLIQAKEYYEYGFSKAIKFTKKAPGFLKTKSAKKLWQFARKNNVTDWWVKLSDFKR